MKYLLANWKMHLGVRESVALARTVLRELRGQDVNPTILLAPSFTALTEVKKVVARSSIALVGQSVASEKVGALTGEISSVQLEDVGATYAIIGHPERMAFGEDEALVRRKLAHLLATPVTPILYLGKDATVPGEGRAVVSEFSRLLKGVEIKRGKRLLVIVEPAHVRTRGRSADPEEIVEVIESLRASADKLGLPKIAISYLYAGHVAAQNVHDYLREPTIDGVAVGASSLKLQQFIGIMEEARDVMRA